MIWFVKDNYRINCEPKLSMSQETPVVNPIVGQLTDPMVNPFVGQMNTMTVNSFVSMISVLMNHMEKPEKFNGLNFKRWQRKMLNLESCEILIL